MGIDTHSPHLPSGAPSRRRRLLAALALAIPLALTACGGGGDDGEATAEPAVATTTSAESAAPSSTPSVEPSTTEPTPLETPTTPETLPTEAPRETPNAAAAASQPDAGECIGTDYRFTHLDHVTCDEAKIMVENILNNGGNRDNGTVADDANRCMPNSTGRGWYCHPDADGVEWPSTMIEPNDPAYDPMSEIERAWRPSVDRSAGNGTANAYANMISVECQGASYDFTDLSGLSCQEAKGMLDPFADSSTDGRIADVTCTRGITSFTDGEREHWDCTRDSGGSLVAYRR